MSAAARRPAPASGSITDFQSQNQPAWSGDLLLLANTFVLEVRIV
jgi:hypothetical protein